MYIEESEVIALIEKYYKDDDPRKAERLKQLNPEFDRSRATIWGVYMLVCQDMEEDKEKNDNEYFTSHGYKLFHKIMSEFI